MDARVAILVEDGYEDLEFWYPKLRLTEAGADVRVVAVEERTYSSEHGYAAEPDTTVGAVDADSFDAVVIPGGRACPDTLRTDEGVLEFVQRIYENNSLVAAICHAAWVPVSAGIVDGHEMTCYQSIKDDVINAGATYVDQAVVVSDNVITSRHPGDLPAFLTAVRRFLEEAG